MVSAKRCVKCDAKFFHEEGVKYCEGCKSYFHLKCFTLHGCEKSVDKLDERCFLCEGIFFSSDQLLFCVQGKHLLHINCFTKHFRKCKFCASAHCPELITSCDVCENNVCLKCGVVCNYCRNRFHKDCFNGHKRRCKKCRKVSCPVNLKVCKNCSHYICEDCSIKTKKWIVFTDHYCSEECRKQKEGQKDRKSPPG